MESLSSAGTVSNASGLTDGNGRGIPSVFCDYRGIQMKIENENEKIIQNLRMGPGNTVAA